MLYKQIQIKEQDGSFYLSVPVYHGSWGINMLLRKANLTNQLICTLLLTLYKLYSPKKQPRKNRGVIGSTLLCLFFSECHATSPSSPEACEHPL